MFLKEDLKMDSRKKLFTNEVKAKDIAKHTDKYFSRTRQIVEAKGDVEATYSIFMRREILMAPRLAVEWLEDVAKEQGFLIDIKANYEEGDIVPASDPFLQITGSFLKLAEIETLLLQKLGMVSVAAYNAREMCLALPNAGFLAMDARHCAGSEMARIMPYAASVGSNAARREAGACGFIGGSTDAGAEFFGNENGFGTMPHALVGYAGSTLKAAKMFSEVHPDIPLVVLNDYFGQEITDSLEVCNEFKTLADKGELSFRLDTHGGRYLEGLDENKSREVLERNGLKEKLSKANEAELKILIGKGVSIAAIYYFREQLDKAGFNRIKIIASSGFNSAKCKLAAEMKAPIDVVGTGSYLPKTLSETYATADIIAYDGEFSVKTGREFLIEAYKKRHGDIKVKNHNKKAVGN